MPDHACGYSCGNRMVRHVPGHHRTCSDHRPFADSYPFENSHPVTDPRAVIDVDSSPAADGLIHDGQRGIHPVIVIVESALGRDFDFFTDDQG